jgi:hypothetical protein
MVQLVLVAAGSCCMLSICHVLLVRGVESLCCHVFQATRMQAVKFWCAAAVCCAAGCLVCSSSRAASMTHMRSWQQTQSKLLWLCC